MKRILAVFALACASAFAEVTRDTVWIDVPDETKVGTVLDLGGSGGGGIDTNAVREIVQPMIGDATNGLVRSGEERKLYGDTTNYWQDAYGVVRERYFTVTTNRYDTYFMSNGWNNVLWLFSRRPNEEKWESLGNYADFGAKGLVYYDEEGDRGRSNNWVLIDTSVDLVAGWATEPKDSDVINFMNYGKFTRMVNYGYQTNWHERVVHNVVYDTTIGEHEQDPTATAKANAAVEAHDASVTAHPDLRAAIGNKQNALTSAQTNAINSGITSAKVAQYNGYATSKANANDVYTKTAADDLFAPRTYTGNYRYLTPSMYSPGYYEWAASSGYYMPLFNFEEVTYEEYPGPDYTYYNVYGGDMLFGVNAGIYNYSTPHYSASTAIGHSATVYTREYASDGCLAFGAGAMANGDAAIAIGNKALAGDMSMMSGSWASGQTAIGFQTTAFGGYSTALGFNTMAYGEGSVAIGYGARVGDYSYGSDSGYHSICISAGGYSYVYGPYEIHFNTGYGGNLSRIYFDGTSLDSLVNTKITSKGYVTTAQLNTKAAEINANVERVRKTIAAELKIVEMADGFHIVKIEEDL